MNRNIIGWGCIIYSFVINFQLTLAIILSIFIILVTIAKITDDGTIDEIEEVTQIMNTSLDELEEIGSMIFVSVSLFIMCVVVFYQFMIGV